MRKTAIFTADVKFKQDGLIKTKPMEVEYEQKCSQMALLKTIKECSCLLPQDQLMCIIEIMLRFGQ